MCYAGGWACRGGLEGEGVGTSYHSVQFLGQGDCDSAGWKQGEPERLASAKCRKRHYEHATIMIVAR